MGDMAVSAVISMIDLQGLALPLQRKNNPIG
jgi:hypothetical protein